MKKLLAAILFLTAGVIYAADQDSIVGFFGPTTNNSGATQIIMSAGSGGKKNCLTDFSIVTSSAMTLSILDGGTTVYAVDLATTSVYTAPVAKSLPFAEDWYGTNALCSGYGSSLSFTMFNSTGSPVGYRINYQGVIRGR